MKARVNIAIGFAIVSIVFCSGLGLVALLPEETRAALSRILATFEITAITVITLAGIVAGLGLLLGLTYAGWQAYHRGAISQAGLQVALAEAVKADREARLTVTTAPPGHQIVAHEVAGLSITHKPLHLAPANVNGQPVNFTGQQVNRWSLYVMANATTRKPDVINEAPLQIEAPLPEYVSLAHYLPGSPSLRSLFLGVGRLPDGQVKPVSAPLARLVHIAAGGSSGFGKSTFMLALAYQILNAREQPAPVMLDGQGVTFTPFDSDNRLLYPLASEPGDILAVITALLGEMTRRQELFSQWRGVSNLEQYNRVADPSDQLPQVPIFFDEFGLVADHKEIARGVKKLAQGGRKAGLYLIAGAQTWGADDIATSLRANLSTSIQFYARDKSQSRVLLGSSAAADITRPGQAFAVLPGQPGLIELQAPDPADLVEVTPELIDPGSRPEMPPLPEPEPDPVEADILNRAAEGDSVSAIARAVLGNDGGNQLKKIREVLTKFGTVSP